MQYCCCCCCCCCPLFLSSPPITLHILFVDPACALCRQVHVIDAVLVLDVLVVCALVCMNQMVLMKITVYLHYAGVLLVSKFTWVASVAFWLLVVLVFLVFFSRLFLFSYFHSIRSVAVLHVHISSWSCPDHTLWVSTTTKTRPQTICKSRFCRLNMGPNMLSQQVVPKTWLKA